MCNAQTKIVGNLKCIGGNITMQLRQLQLQHQIEAMELTPEQYRTSAQKGRLTDLKIQLALVQREPKCCATDISFLQPTSTPTLSDLPGPKPNPNPKPKLRDTYYVIDSVTPEMQGFDWLSYYGPEGLGYELPLHLLESEQQGQEAPQLICDNTLTYEGIVLGLEDDVWNGWDDLEEVTPK